MNGFRTGDAVYMLLWYTVINLSSLTLHIKKDDELPTQRPKSTLETVGLTWYVEKRKRSHPTSLNFICSTAGNVSTSVDLTFPYSTLLPPLASSRNPL